MTQQQQVAREATHHWVMTVQWPVGSSGFGVTTVASPAVFLPGTSRAEAYQLIREYVIDYLRGYTGQQVVSMNVLFFALERNEI